MASSGSNDIASLGPELIAKIKEELRRSYDAYRRVEFAKETKYLWDSRGDKTFTLDSSAPRIPRSWELSSFCNKPTYLYWAHAAQDEGRRPLWVLGCIYKEWFRHSRPDIEFGHFFANPISVTPTGPASIPGILVAHRSLCDQTSLHLGQIERGELKEPYGSAWPNTHHFKLRPLCRAIVVLLDELSLVESYEEDEEDGGMVYLDDKMERQSVVLVRTGDDARLSRPISFVSLRAHSLPLARDDLIGGDVGVDAIRVSLGLAVRFIKDLEQREERAYPHVRPSTVDGSICPSAVFNGPPIRDADEYVEKIMEKPSERRLDKYSGTRAALKAIETASNGSNPDKDDDSTEIWFLSSRWI